MPAGTSNARTLAAALTLAPEAVTGAPVAVVSSGAMDNIELKASVVVRVTGTWSMIGLEAVNWPDETSVAVDPAGAGRVREGKISGPELAGALGGTEERTAADVCADDNPSDAGEDVINRTGELAWGGRDEEEASLAVGLGEGVAVKETLSGAAEVDCADDEETAVALLLAVATGVVCSAAEVGASPVALVVIAADVSGTLESGILVEDKAAVVVTAAPVSDERGTTVGQALPESDRFNCSRERVTRSQVRQPPMSGTRGFRARVPLPTGMASPGASCRVPLLAVNRPDNGSCQSTVQQRSWLLLVRFQR